MDSDLKELIRLAEEIAVIEAEDYYPIPWEKVNQRDVLRKRVNKKIEALKEILEQKSAISVMRTIIKIRKGI